MPGPAEEIETVRWIYRSFVEEGKLESEIADLLNARGITTDLGRVWTRGTVHQVLINEKYIGNNVWNRVSFKLKKKRVRNSPDMWVRADGVFEPIVDRHLFDAAQVIIRERSYRLSDEEMLDGLRDLLEERGYLSGLIIDETDQLPSSSAYQSRFGSLAASLSSLSVSRLIATTATSRSIAPCGECIPHIVADTIAGIVSARRPRRPGPRHRSADHQWRVHGLDRRCSVSGYRRRVAPLADPV